MHAFPRTVAASLLVGALFSAGCSHISLLPKNPVVHADKLNPAAEVVSLWQPAKGPGLNGVPGRGLAGQILFFTRGSSSPVAVEGDVRVYLFDNQGTAEEQAKPIWQFDFPAEDWQTFGSVGTLGPSYNIFIPYVREGQQQVECAIQIRFTPKGGAGPVLYSEMTPVTIPGKIDATEGGFLPEKSPKMTPLTPLGSTAEPTKLNPDPHSLNVHTIRPHAPGNATAPGKPVTPGNIEQASYAAEPGESAWRPAPRATNAVVHADYAERLPAARDQRLEELERYVRELRAEQAQAKAREERVPAFDAVNGELNPDEPSPESPRRLRLTPAAPPSASTRRTDAGELTASEWLSAE